MKYLILLVIALISVVGLHAQIRELSDQEIETEIQVAQIYIGDEYSKFVDPETSPLPADSIPYHKGLHYFEPMDPKYVVYASFERLDSGRIFEMKTNTDRLPVYKDYAIMTFYIDGKEYKLHAYQNLDLIKKEEYKDYLFVPFNDHTNGIETYGGGRYLDLREPIGDFIILNFHRTYNPYCAYNPRYSCVIPPDENRLAVGIKAGEKVSYTR